ncbi:hypothetical protein EG68_08909 [Paragonimus skrjabini miyazakii]|uniref:Uncharacterized protein n=1 Tax=Paragonimus skrjabini miyazakii TaxID=59628 RepID=A0A8S9YRX8_9TREM|nr:hypothetical protein EG68_08909 [Paragonimus skrjabini miyazakii]
MRSSGFDRRRSPAAEPPYKRSCRVYGEDYCITGSTCCDVKNDGNSEDEGFYRLLLVPFKWFLEPLNDSVTEEETCSKYHEYKDSYFKRHIEDVFEAHKNEGSHRGGTIGGPSDHSSDEDSVKRNRNAPGNESCQASSLNLDTKKAPLCRTTTDVSPEGIDDEEDTPTPTAAGPPGGVIVTEGSVDPSVLLGSGSPRLQPIQWNSESLLGLPNQLRQNGNIHCTKQLQFSSKHYPQVQQRWNSESYALLYSGFYVWPCGSPC